MNLESLAERLEAQGVGTRGIDIFVDRMPTGITLGILLRQPYRGTPIDYELPGYRKGDFQLVVRSKTKAAGKTLMNEAVAALTVNEAELTGMDVRYIRPAHDPVSYPISEGNNIEFSVNFDAVFVLV